MIYVYNLFLALVLTLIEKVKDFATQTSIFLSSWFFFLYKMLKLIFESVKIEGKLTY